MVLVLVGGIGFEQAPRLFPNSRGAASYRADASSSEQGKQFPQAGGGRVAGVGLLVRCGIQH
jgi:hypothetical protein